MADGLPYELRDRIARGGMADVYLALDRNNQYVVVRRLRDDLAGKGMTVRQFTWGNKVLTELNHPNIVRYIDSGKSNSLPYVVLEYVDGPNLRELIVGNYETVRQHMRPILWGMADALNHVHERGFLHLDFKPENLLLPRDYVVKLIDFDLCIRRADKPVKLKKIAGTPAYLAPELLGKRIVDERSDIFSFGVAAYEVLTGRKPVQGNSVNEVYHAYMDMDQPIPLPRTFNKEIPIRLERVILKCLAKDMEQRYPVMSLVLRDLRSLE